MPDPGAPAGPAGKKANRKKLLIYGAIGGGLLLVFMLLRGRGAAAAPSSTTTTPTTASDGLAAGSSGIDNSQQLAAFENALLTQLPQAISSGLQAGQANGVGPAATTDATTQLTSLLGAISPLLAQNQNQNTGASAVSELGGLIGALSPLLMGTGAGGQQVGAGNNVGSSVGAQNVQATAHPVAVAQAVNNQASNPRRGLSYTTTTYKGRTVHQYPHSVSGGVGPGKNLIVV